MIITELKIRKLLNDDRRIKAIVSITLDNVFVTHDIKIVELNERTIVAMPSRRKATGNFVDIVHPINKSFRDYLNEKIIGAYKEAIEQ